MRMNRAICFPFGACAFLSLGLWSEPAAAQRTGFAIDRFEPAERGHLRGRLGRGRNAEEQQCPEGGASGHGRKSASVEMHWPSQAGSADAEA